MIIEDKGYLSSLDLLAIDRGIAQLDVFMLRLGRESLTEEEKTHNVQLAKTLSSGAWQLHCDRIKKDTAQKIHALLEALSPKFIIYQYKKDYTNYRDDWDFFFWCNCNSDGRDYSYVTLSTNKNRTLEQRIEDVKRIIGTMQKTGLDGIEVAIQYTATYDKDKVKGINASYLCRALNRPVEMMGHRGKIKPVGVYSNGDIAYGFFKKGARSKYYQLSDEQILALALEAEKPSPATS